MTGRTRWPAAVHELIEHETDCAYVAGYCAALHHVAMGHAELDATWRRAGRRGYARMVAERLALFEQCAADLAQRMGRPAGYRYDGGPVDWVTGRPVSLRGAAA